MSKRWLAALLLGIAFFISAHTLFAQDSSEPDGVNRIYLPAIFGDQTANVEAEQGDADSALTVQAVRIYFDADGQLPDLAYELDLLEEPATAGYALALVNDEELERLLASGVRAEVDAERTARLLAAQAVVLQQRANASASTPLAGIPGYACYRTVEETYSALAALAAAHPNLASWVDIGDSWEKITPGGAAGYDLNALVLTNKAKPAPKPRFMLIAAIHAREYATAELATRFAEELLAKYDVDPNVTWLLDYFEVHILPQVNPDGRKIAESGQLWRKNTDNDDGCNLAAQWGTDLNRNSSFKWGWPGASSNACDPTYRGPAASSEPETAAIQAYAASIFPDQRGPADGDSAAASAEGVFISLHSYGELVLFPWGWTTSPAPNAAQLRTLGRKFGYFNGYQVCTGPNCLYGTSGTTDDYTYGVLGVASYTFEVGRNFFEQCSFFTSNILPKNLPALHYALRAARRPYENPAGPDVLNLTVSPSNATSGATLLLSAMLDDTRYNSNGWGVEASQAIQAARYTLDTPSWGGGLPVSLSAADGVYNASSEAISATINSAALSVGRHTIFVEGQDAAGNWGVTSAVFVTITSGATATPVLPTATPTLTATPTPTATSTPVPPPSGDTYYLSSTTSGVVGGINGGIAFEDEDILSFNTGNRAWSLIIDGSDVGIAVDVDAFALLGDGSWLMSLDAATTLPGLGAVDDSDIVRFIPVRLGAETAGSFEMYFHAADVGLTTSNEDVDLIAFAPDGRLALSTVGAFGVSGLSGEDEDLLAFSASSLGWNTAGRWSLYFDGSDVGLSTSSSEDLNAGWIDPVTGKLYLSTMGAFAVTGVSGDGADIFICTPERLGAVTACTFGPGLLWDGSQYGFGGEDSDGFWVIR
jgi:hypothetical protein